MPQRTWTTLESPVGPLTAVTDDNVLSGLYLDDQRHRPDESRFGTHDATAFAAAREQLTAYFTGDLHIFDLPLTLTGTDFQRRVWSVLQRIPYGETWSYGRVATELGQPSASRAVGLANGRNPISIVVPCHRVIGSTGSLTGYGGGLHRKQQLLDLERGPGLALFA